MSHTDSQSLVASTPQLVEGHGSSSGGGGRSYRFLDLPETCILHVVSFLDYNSIFFHCNKDTRKIKDDLARVPWARDFPTMYNMFNPGTGFPCAKALREVSSGGMKVRVNELVTRRNQSHRIHIGSADEPYYVVSNENSVFFFTKRLSNMFVLSDTENFSKRELTHPLMDINEWNFVAFGCKHDKFCNSKYCVLIFYGEERMHVSVLNIVSADTTWKHFRLDHPGTPVKYAATLDVTDAHIKYVYFLKNHNGLEHSRMFLEQRDYSQTDAPVQSFLLSSDTSKHMIFFDGTETMRHALTSTHCIFVTSIDARVTFKFFHLEDHTVTWRSLQNPIVTYRTSLDALYRNMRQRQTTFYSLRKCFVLGDFIFFFVADSHCIFCAHLGPSTLTPNISWYPPLSIGGNVGGTVGSTESLYGPWCIYKQRALMLFRWNGPANDRCQFIRFFQHPSSEALWDFYPKNITERHSSFFSLVDENVHTTDLKVMTSIFDGVSVRLKVFCLPFHGVVIHVLFDQMLWCILFSNEDEAFDLQEILQTGFLDSRNHFYDLKIQDFTRFFRSCDIRSQNIRIDCAGTQFWVRVLYMQYPRLPSIAPAVPVNGYVYLGDRGDLVRKALGHTGLVTSFYAERYLHWDDDQFTSEEKLRDLTVSVDVNSSDWLPSLPAYEWATTDNKVFKMVKRKTLFDKKQFLRNKAYRNYVETRKGDPLSREALNDLQHSLSVQDEDDHYDPQIVVRRSMRLANSNRDNTASDQGAAGGSG